MQPFELTGQYNCMSRGVMYSDSVFVDTKTQAVNTLPLHEMTSSSSAHSPREWTTSFMGEQQELDSILADLLSAFPSQHSAGGRLH